MGERRTWRDVDGERVEGTWRHVFVSDGQAWCLVDLFVYADGMVDCWGLMTFDELTQRFASGRMTTSPPQGARGSADVLMEWTFDEPQSWLSTEGLLGELRDAIEELNGRPTSTQRCLAAVEVFRRNQTEDNRAVLRAAYQAIPEHLRIRALEDADTRDWPLAVLAAGPGNRFEFHGVERVVTEEMHAAELRYFDEREEWLNRSRRDERSPAR
ncbi:DUF7638 domain-containing protein [Lentzea guizhouensis]|nr:hypothetical protein [Lentzea guizhouensis]